MIQTENEAFWYLPDNRTEQQSELLVQFKQKLATSGVLLPGHDDDPTLLRFLKARQWNLEPAALMYTNMAKWRKEQQVDDLYNTYEYQELSEVVKHYPHFYHKQDKYGRPVYIELLGRTDCTKMLAASSMERIMKYHIWTWERFEKQLLPACSKLMSKPVITCTVIIDLAGLSLKNFNLTTQRLLHTIAKVDQDYYPEHLGTMFIVNTPFIFKTIWAVVCPLLEERTRKKIMVLGSDYLSTVTQLIPAENLPTFLGGKSDCPDHVASVGPWSECEPCASCSWTPRGPEHNNPARMAAVAAAAGGKMEEAKEAGQQQADIQVQAS